MIPSLHTVVAFTGHRTYCGQADDALRDTVVRLYAGGARSFLSGMAVGFDLAAAEAVLDCRAQCPQIRLVCVVPFEGQAERYSAVDRERFERVCAAADECVVLAAAYHRGCYTRRNDYLVAHASLLVAWYDSSPGGTQYTLRRALDRGREVWNLHPSARVSIQPVQGTMF